MNKPQTVDEYISCASPNVKQHLGQLRTAIMEVAPQAQEVISYQMPTYKLNGYLVSFGGFSKHVSLFPGAAAVEAFKEELSDYKTSVGTIQFPVNKPVPIDLVKKILQFKIENMAKSNDEQSRLSNCPIQFKLF